MRWLLVLLAIVLPVRAAACSFALMLSMDASGSIDSGEWRMQTGGLAAALRDPEVSHFLVARDVRLAVFQWSGEAEQDLTIGWTAIPDAAALDAFARRVEALPRRWNSGTTAIATALRAMTPVMAASGCAKQVIDVSGDGESNEFLRIEGPRQALGAMGVTVNALAIEPAGIDWFLNYKSLADYYHHKLIIGPGSFVEQADGHEDYPRAILDKLRREVSEPVG